MQNTKILEIHEAWAMENGYRLKGASFKRQAASRKRKMQARILKLQKFFEYQSN